MEIEASNQLSLESLFSSDETISEIDTPDSAIGRVWPGCKVIRNQGGASSIARSAAQHVGF